jgi:O-antigen/teichoic acid export membrane protein
LQAVGASVVASLAMLLALGVALRSVVPAGVSQAVPEYHTRLWVSTTVQHTVLGALGLIINEVDVLLVGSFVPPAQVGLYAAASRASKVIPFGLAAISFVVAPYISELYSQGKRQELQRILTLAAYGILVTALPVAAVMLLAGGRVMAVFGPEFIAARPVLTILVLGQLVNAMCGSIGLLLVMTGHHRYNIMVVGTCAALDVLLCWILAPRYGIIGGAIATSLTLAGWNIILSWTAWRVVGVDPTILSLASRRRPDDRSV